MIFRERTESHSSTTPIRYERFFSAALNNWPVEAPRIVMNDIGNTTSTNSVRRSRTSNRTSFLVICQAFITNP
jgi:hypothetical protein